ncbi:glycine betaine ABC transporter substrate-binding protein [Gordonia sp. CPCC 205515]|uniref:glycine betaine ABC transporter substrate-binding protein n=1 Tax=Gordonia sp. CPCC 205515 TaxID=3140791 RepID=UPI003AF39FCD
MITRARVAMLLVMAVAAVVTGCSESTAAEDHALVMGAADTPTMQVMAQIYAGALRNAGSAVSSEVRTGDDRTLLDEMDTATVDLFPAFSGRLLAELAPQATPVSSDEVYKELNKALPQGVSVGDPTMVSAQPHVFVATRTAEHAQVTDLADCGRLPAGLPVVVTGSPDAATIGATSAAGCRFGAVQTVSSTADVLSRVAAGTAVGILTPLDVAGDDAGGAGEIRTVAVAGTRAQDLVPIYRDAAFSRDEVKTVNKVAGELTTADLATLTRRAITGAKPADLANGWLAEHGL